MFGLRVALIEAGPSDLHFPVNVKTTLPIGNVFLLPHARYNWQHVYSGGPEVNGRQIPCPRGKLFGGCTSVNGTVYMRGHSTDYDEWGALGNEGWDYQNVLAHYKRHENYAGEASNFHGAGGELDVQKPRENNPLAHALIEAVELMCKRLVGGGVRHGAGELHEVRAACEPDEPDEQRSSNCHSDDLHHEPP